MKVSLEFYEKGVPVETIQEAVARGEKPVVMRRLYEEVPVSYTHLDVYKRQAKQKQWCGHRAVSCVKFFRLHIRLDI